MSPYDNVQAELREAPARLLPGYKPRFTIRTGLAEALPRYVATLAWSRG